MTFLDFFSGVGGFRKGFELYGMACKGHCEIDKFADRSYRAIHDVKEDEWYGEDITKTNPADLPRVNLWAGGFPCQDISVSGRQRGLAGKRSSLFFEIVRLLKGTPAEDRPEWLVLENVKNLLSVNRGWDFATVLHSLAEIGYHIEYGLLIQSLCRALLCRRCVRRDSQFARPGQQINDTVHGAGRFGLPLFAGKEK